jgi:predicted translin family RNA/ssDNA-binding protein
MISKKFIEKLKKDYAESNSERRQIISLANVVLHDSKRVIFSLHRGDNKIAEESLIAIEEVLKKLEKKFGYSRIMEEGSYKAGVEEYVEAKTLFMVINGQKIDAIKGLKIDVEGYLGGICDLTGELVRRAVNQAASGNWEEVPKIKKIINDIMAELVQFDMTGYLRTKYDQARGNLRKIEQVDYEVKLKRGN